MLSTMCLIRLINTMHLRRNIHRQHVAITTRKQNIYRMHSLKALNSMCVVRAPRAPSGLNILYLNGTDSGIVNNACFPSTVAPSYAPTGQVSHCDSLNLRSLLGYYIGTVVNLVHAMRF